MGNHCYFNKEKESVQAIILLHPEGIQYLVGKKLPQRTRFLRIFLCCRHQGVPYLVQKKKFCVSDETMVTKLCFFIPLPEIDKPQEMLTYLKYFLYNVFCLDPQMLIPIISHSF